MVIVRVAAAALFATALLAPQAAQAATMTATSPLSVTIGVAASGSGTVGATAR